MSYNPTLSHAGLKHYFSRLTMINLLTCRVSFSTCRKVCVRIHLFLPVSQVQVSDQALTAFGVRDDGAVLGCGTADGCCSVMQLSSALVDMVPNEKQTVNAMFERETLRCAGTCSAWSLQHGTSFPQC